MSHLNYLEKLLDGVDVEWKLLDELIVSLKTGLNPRKNFQLNTDDADGYYVTVREIQNGKVVFLEKTDRVNRIALELINNRSNLEAGDILFSGTGTVGRTAVIKEKPLNWNIKEGVYVIKPLKQIVSPKYLSHLLNSQEIVKEYSRKIVGSPVISLPMGELKKLKIPIPCPDNPEKSLAIQAEIVRILDAFTDMTAELTTELTAELNLRKKQYNYYRDKLLSFGDGEVEWKTLGEVTQLITKGTTPKEFVNDGVNFIKLESFDDNRIKPDKFMFITPEVHNKALKRSVLEENDILFAIAGATIGKCAIVDKSVLPANTNQALAIVRLTQQVKVKFAFYYMQTTAMTDYIAKFNKTSAQPNINLKQMSEFKIPVPSINEQIRIIQILDNFNTSTSSIKEGLLREIELRQKQYEYYRDLLLSFPKSTEGAV
ncbi:restriction endonuclease subunit S [Vibrio vulnificus]|uniref:restriction endonuclease subunit S n=1 Tax=Vibrio vulnificus TaxID=672 RepID=UPI001DD227AA|nr:restriction endonuclease subunit S [Vibrio vulnificus]EHS1184923.1 restriction endonuclease subunit S [Vibrio vulnificus]MCG6296140.1 restriction endonuclease subunit S [Vibrio vulnificus]MCU8220011.1 restriction endonuclease subunit S [Vibrio vulnificus]MCU8429200.1 restriction endonuclease subunit S [Vibrio vulnificus]